MKLTVLFGTLILGGTLFFTACENSASKSSASTETAAAGETGSGESSAGNKDSKAAELDDTNFDQEIKSGVVLVDFWATWCPPCRTQGPIVDALAGKVSDYAKVAKLDVDKAPKAAQAYGINSIPTLIIFKDGKKVKQFVGVTQEDELLAEIKKAAGK